MTPWSVSQDIATLRQPQFTATVNTAQPNRGLGQLMVASRALPGAQWLGISLDADHDSATPPDDCYVRGNDLIATYLATSPRPYRVQIYWRALDPSNEPGTIAGVELVVSVQTHLLDSHPQLMLSSHLPTGEVSSLMLSATEADFSFGGLENTPLDLSRPNQCSISQRHAGCLVLRTADSDLSHVQMIHPSDFQLVAVDGASDGVDLHAPLFERQLEKGVIRRARARGLFVRRDSDLEIALRSFQQFAASQPVLTT